MKDGTERGKETLCPRLIEERSIMNKSLLALAAFATIASGAAFAGEADPAGQFAVQIQGARTRAEVQAEAVAAVKSGATSPSAIPTSSRVQAPVVSTLEARAVRAQAAEAVRLGQIGIGERGSF